MTARCSKKLRRVRSNLSEEVDVTMRPEWVKITGPTSIRSGNVSYKGKRRGNGDIRNPLRWWVARYWETIIKCLYAVRCWNTRIGIIALCGNDCIVGGLQPPRTRCRRCEEWWTDGLAKNRLEVGLVMVKNISFWCVFIVSCSPVR